MALINKYDAIATITDVDLNIFRQHGCRIPIIHVPFGINMLNYKVDTSATIYPSVFHIGSMDWMPNIEGIRWIIEKVWPQVIQRRPDLKLFLAGKNMPQWLVELKTKNVEIVGEVSDAHSFIRSNSIMIVPLFSGGGMRIKIIEGMALEKTIISTSIGAEGILYEDGKQILIADTEDEFVDAIIKCASDMNFAKQLGLNARQLIAKKYDNTIICGQLSQFYKDLTE